MNAGVRPSACIVSVGGLVSRTGLLILKGYCSGTLCLKGYPMQKRINFRFRLINILAVCTNGAESDSRYVSGGFSLSTILCLTRSNLL